MSARDTTSYGQRYIVGLPWGYWMAIDAIGSAGRPLVDEKGGRWGSLRQRLWVERLQMGNGEGIGWGADAELDFLLQVLATYSRQVQSAGERTIDLFISSRRGRQHYEEWLTGHGLIVDKRMLGGIQLTDEGHAILLMLVATRAQGEPETPINPPGGSGYSESERMPDYAGLAKAIEDAERALPALAARFMRVAIGNEASITLASPSVGAILQLETIWSMTFSTDYERDRMFLWLLARANRWADWAELVRSEGARSLTEHFLGLMMATARIDIPLR